MISEAIRVLPRSFLYVPGHREEMIGKATKSGADALILDLEDAVPRSSKSAARSVVAAALARARQVRSQLWVRVNADLLKDDLVAVAKPGLAGIMIAKCDAQSAEEAASLLAELMPRSAIPVVGLIESAAALRDIDRIATGGNVEALAVGLVDLLADLRIDSSATSILDGIFLRIVLASAAAGLLPPVAPTRTDFRDLDAFGASSLDFLARGFRSRTAIHPAQAAVINKVFSPDPERLQHAQNMLREFESAGQGIFIDGSGRMIDAAVVREARELVERARLLR